MGKKGIVMSMYGIISVLTIILILGIGSPFVKWNRRSSTPMKVWIIDKTVPVPNYREHKGVSFNGEYFKTSANASPCEAWLAMNCDYVVRFEEEKFKNQHPVAIVSWPTLDVIEHDSEWNSQGDKSKEYNDKVSININNIDRGEKLKAGFFGAYHIYPNHPDFMNNQASYNNYKDSEGRLRYGGYLKEFIEKHTKYPALVAEFGLATGMGNAHTCPDGYNHGGLTEKQQGDGIVTRLSAKITDFFWKSVIFAESRDNIMVIGLIILNAHILLASSV